MSTKDGSEEINQDRRRFCGTAAMSIAAAKFGMMGSANAPSRHVTAASANALTEKPPAGSGDSSVRAFHISVPEQEIVELRRRIVATRWPDREIVNDRSQGVQLETMRELIRYWGTDYDWRKVEARLNALPEFITNMRTLCR